MVAGTEENHNKVQTGQPVSGPRFKPGTPKQEAEVTITAVLRNYVKSWRNVFILYEVWLEGDIVMFRHVANKS